MEPRSPIAHPFIVDNGQIYNPLRGEMWSCASSKSYIVKSPFVCDIAQSRDYVISCNFVIENTCQRPFCVQSRSLVPIIFSFCQFAHYAISKHYNACLNIVTIASIFTWHITNLLSIIGTKGF